MYHEVRKSNVSWNDYTFILPAVSVANVGQLACDLLISTFWMEKAGHILHEAVIPLVGNDPFAVVSEGENSGTFNLSTACEVFESQSCKLVVLQQRAPLVSHLKKKFVEDLVEWIKEKKFKRVVLLSSTFSDERIDCQLGGQPLRYKISPLLREELEPSFRNLRWRELESRSFSHVGPFVGKFLGDNIYVPGGGMTKAFYEQCISEGVPLVVLIMFTSDGDNIPDAMLLLNQLNQWVQVIDPEDKRMVDIHRNVKWRQPPSWRNLFGFQACADIY